MAFPSDPNNRGIAITMVVFGVLLVVAGISICVLTHETGEAAIQFLQNLQRGRAYHFGTGGNWWNGLWLIVFAASCIIAGAVDKRPGYIVNVVLAVCAIIGYGVWMIDLFNTVRYLDVLDVFCVGRSACQSMLSNFRGLVAAVVLGWVLVLAALVVSCVKLCRTSSEQPTPGVVISQQPPAQPVAQVATFPSQGHNVQDPGAYPMAPPEYKAKIDV